MSRFTFLLALCLVQYAPVALAQEFVTPDKAQREGMSYEEYSALREKMRTRMEKMHPDRQVQEGAASPAEQSQRGLPERAYGQGFDARRHELEKPERAIERNPGRPRFERFNRRDRLRH